MNFNELIKSGDHEAISKIEDKNFSHFRAIAYINLGNFEEALKHVTKNSFEHAYILYKLKNYKRSLRILRKIDGTASETLKSQCLFYMGYYNTAYSIHSKITRDEDVVVNLQAMKSMAMLADKGDKRNKYSVESKDDPIKFEELDKFKFKSTDNLVDFVFNKSFEKLSDEKKFVTYLKEQVESNSVFKGTIVEEQLKNITGEFEDINFDNLSKNQKETVLFNTGKISGIKAPVHFQKNICKKDLEKCGELNPYLYYSAVKDGEIELKNIPSLSDEHRLLKAYLAFKKGCNNGEVMRKSLKKVPSSIYKNIMLLLADVKINPDEFQEKAKKIISEIKEKK